MGEELAQEKIAEILKKANELSDLYGYTEGIALEALIDWIEEEYYV